VWSRLTAKSMPNIQVHVMVIVWSRDLLSSTDSGRPAQASGVPTISIVPKTSYSTHQIMADGVHVLAQHPPAGECLETGIDTMS
jgi:hypothetical protein